MSKKIDLNGQRFGRLVVNSFFENKGTVFANCVCDCGNESVVRLHHLKSGHAKSCGCLRIEKAKEHSDFLIKEREKVSVEGTNLLSLTSKKPKNNTSGFKGVCWNKQRNKWHAYLKLRQKMVFSDFFENKQDAINARKEAEEKYFKPILDKYGKESN